MGIIRYKIILGEYLRGLRRIMKCKKCKADIPDELHPMYCCYCGEKLQRERKKKGEIKIPTPRKRGQKLSAAILNASAPFLPFTLITWHLCGICAPVPICGV